MDAIKVLAFDTGGTVLDWHGALPPRSPNAAAFAVSLMTGTNSPTNTAAGHCGGCWAPSSRPSTNDVHREVFDELLREQGVVVFSGEDRAAIAARWHQLDVWPDFVPALARMRQCFPCVSFTILSLSLVVDVSRRNAIAWDAVISCEMLGVYKTRPEAYRRTAGLLQATPAEILMVACHNFDLDAARREGYRTAFVRRPDEWGPAGPPDPVPNPATDIVADDFAELADRLGV
jgi:2-haloacid dehalogenase